MYHVYSHSHIRTTVRPVHVYHDTQGWPWDLLLHSHIHTCIYHFLSRPGVPWYMRMALGCTMCTNTLTYILVSVPSMCTAVHKDGPWIYHVYLHSHIHTTVRPVHVYHGTQGWSWDTLSHNIYHFLSRPGVPWYVACVLTLSRTYQCLSCPCVPRYIRMALGCTMCTHTLTYIHVPVSTTVHPRPHVAKFLNRKLAEMTNESDDESIKFLNRKSAEMMNLC